MFDCHVHSNFSGDSKMPAETACEAALQQGLKGIAFTDHLDYDYPNFDDTFNIDFEQYSQFMDALKAQYSEKLKVLKGIEVGIQPHVIEATEKVVESFSFDFVIASVHIIDKQDPYVGDYFIGKTKEQAYRRYLEEILFSVSNYTNFDIVGHIGYVRRYGDFSDRSLRHSDYSDILDEILRTVITLGKGIEVNTSGYRSGLGSPMPDFDIVNRYRELGGEIICLGSDAHYVEHVGHSFDIAKELLIQSGFRYVTHFENRKPVFEKIEA